MIKKALAFVACILAAFSANAQSPAVKAAKGETEEATSVRFHQTLSALRAAAPHAGVSNVGIGVALYLSSKSGFSSSKVAAVAPSKPTAVSGNGYTFVKAGAHDNDYTIARRFDTSAKSIRILNPEIVWSRLRPGAKVKVPVAGAVASKGSAAQAILASAPKKAEKTAAPKEVAATTYTTSGDDNDWIIARKFGMTPPMIRAANPDVDWNKLRPGRKIKIPAVTGSTALAVLKKRKGITTHYAILRGDNVNVRAGARTDSESVLQVDGGTPVVIIDRMDNWYKLKFPHGTKGWVRGDLLEPQESRPKAFLAYQRQNDDPQPVYASRRRNDDDDEDSRPSMRRHRSESRVANRNHSTKRYAYPGPSRRNRSEDTMAYTGGDGDGVLTAARSRLGERYRFGASGPNATDCSGFTQSSYRRVGVNLPRTAREQASIGKPVSRAELKPGDLVFFHTTRSGISHVGIYKGNNEFIHASSGKGHVTISKLEGYYDRRFVTARRVRNASKSSSSGSSKKASSKSSSKPKIKFSVD